MSRDELRRLVFLYRFYDEIMNERSALKSTLKNRAKRKRKKK